MSERTDDHPLRVLEQRVREQAAELAELGRRIEELHRRLDERDQNERR
ncbi:MAG: hypothetical protein AB7G12_12690 [Thermoanaerobaculia bacterium]